MIRNILLFMFLLGTKSLFAQDITTVKIVVESGDEPPTNYGALFTEIQLKQNKQGDYTAKKYTLSWKRKKGKKNQRLKEPMSLSKASVDTLLVWLNTPKESFTFHDLGYNYELLNEALQKKPLTFTHPINKDLVIQLDTFQFCYEHLYMKTKSFGIGGYTIYIELLEDGKLFKKYKQDRNYYQDEFNLKEYFAFCTLLKDKIPQDFYKPDIFTEEQLTKILCYYLEVKECEGFYYREYLKQHPEKTSQDKRTRAGWDFKKYLEERKITKP